MNYVELLRTMLIANQNPNHAIHMEKYMRNHFSFLGIKSPERRIITKEFFQETNLLKQDFSPDFVLELWQQEQREFQMIGLDYIEKSLKKLTKDHLSFMKQLITTKSWWDTVDMLAQKPVGHIAKNHPEVIQEVINGWAIHDNMWLRRTAILFQLKYKDRTDEQLLYQYIKQNANSNEFFIQKAIGWALREYSKTNPTSVKIFIEDHELAKLSIREGSKYI